jgi:hypothetical protein
METAMRDDLDPRTTRDNLDNLTPNGMREEGMGMGTIAAIAAAVLVVGALFLWPRDANQSASNTAPATTVGQTRTAPAPSTPAPAPSPAAPATTK